MEKLAEYLDAHNLTDFEEELEEVVEPVFIRDAAIEVHRESGGAETVEQMVFPRKTRFGAGCGR